MKYKNGTFRRFGFVGFEKEDEAKSAKEYFDGTYLKQSRVSVEICSIETGKYIYKLLMKWWFLKYYNNTGKYRAKFLFVLTPKNSLR